MDPTLRTNLNKLWSQDRELQGQAFQAMLKATDIPVDWAYEAWDELLQGLSHADNHDRAIAAQVLCNLVKSDPQKRMLQDFAALLAVTKDERFVTARHTMQSLWKVGVAGPEQREMYLKGMEQRFHECLSEKNWEMIRSDIQKSLRNVYDVVKDEQIRLRALRLMDTEKDPKSRKKYLAPWRKK